MPHTVLTIGYNHYRIPDSIKIDQIKEIVNAEPLANYYGDNGYGYSGDKEISINICNDDQIQWTRKVDDLDEVQTEIMDQILERVKEKTQIKSLYFRKDEIKVGGDNNKWPEFADPEFDPADFIYKIVQKATK
jgi:hypothetical protein